MGETTEPTSVQVDSQGLVSSHKHIYSHVELLASDQKGIHNVALHDVGLGLRTIGLPTEIVLPLGDLL